MLNLKTIFVFFCLSVFFLGLAEPVFAQDPPLPTPVGRVVWVKGTIEAVMPNEEIRQLKKTSVIYLKDKLVTGEGSQAQIVFTDNTLMTFRENTQFVIDDYKYNPGSKTKSAGKYVMSLIEGGFRTITGLIAKKNPNDYQINTPVATIGVRGTNYAVYFREGEMYIGYYDGKPCITSKKDEKSFCLDKNNPYAKVDLLAGIVPLLMRPDQLGPPLEILPAKISPFRGGGGSQGVQSSSGTVGSFCIT